MKKWVSKVIVVAVALLLSSVFMPDRVVESRSNDSPIADRTQPASSGDHTAEHSNGPISFEQLKEQVRERQLRRDAKKREKVALKIEVDAMPLNAVAEQVFNSDIDPMSWMYRSTISPATTIDILLEDPFVYRLFDITKNGSVADRDFVKTELLAYCHRFLEELPDGPDFNAKIGWQASQTSPGNAMIVPILLANLDQEGEMLEIVLSLVMKTIEVTPEVARRYLGASYLDDTVRYSQFEPLSAVAVYEICMHIVKGTRRSDPVFNTAMNGFEVWQQTYTRDDVLLGAGNMELIRLVQGAGTVVDQ